MGLYFSERLHTDNTELVRRAKIGTYTPCIIWVHEDDIPLEKDKHFRYLETEPTDHGFYPDYGVVDEIRENNWETIYFVSGGSPTEVEELEIDIEE